MQEKHIFFSLILTKAELLALTLADFNFKDNTINITKSLQHKASGDIVTPLKTDNGIRTITMPEAVMQEIKGYAQKIYGIKPSDRVFTFTKSLIRGNMKRGAEKAEIPFIRIHDMRHSHVPYHKDISGTTYTVAPISAISAALRSAFSRSYFRLI